MSNLIVPHKFYIGSSPGSKDWTGNKAGKMWHVPKEIVDAKRVTDPDIFPDLNGGDDRKLVRWLESIARFLPGRT